MGKIISGHKFRVGQSSPEVPCRDVYDAPMNAMDLCSMLTAPGIFDMCLCCANKHATLIFINIQHVPVLFIPHPCNSRSVPEPYSICTCASLIAILLVCRCGALPLSHSTYYILSERETVVYSVPLLSTFSAPPPKSLRQSGWFATG